VIRGSHGPWPILAGRSAVVTGGANGIGAAVVHELAAAGASSGVVLDLEPSLGRGTAPDGWREVAVDLRDDDSIRSAFAETRDAVGGTIDVLVAVAGIVPAWTGIADLDPDVWDDVFRVNARGVMRTVQEAEPALRDGGAIVVIASQNVEEALTAEGLTTPLQRLATAEEVARAVLFLASDLASGVSGHIVPVGSPFV
jgi:NAD(P)-dependent dehydrogenase (short-subunit alcohol dehydrogenase family)